MNLKDLERTENTQSFFDAFNEFILSSDTRVFGKLIARAFLMNKVKNLPGDIVECGVFKGTGLMTFLKLKRFLCPNSLKKIIGFDFFDSELLIQSLEAHDKESMSILFKERNYKHEKNHVNDFNRFILSKGFQKNEFDLVAGDICETAKKYCSNKPGFRISLLYIDLDVEKPTYEALSALWDRVVKGGIVVFDEYAFDVWSESNGVDKFFEDKNVKIKSLNFICPSAYVVKK